MTASAKEVIAAAILEDLADITYAEDDGGLGADGWIYLPKLSAAILAALDAAGLVVVPREPTAAIDAAWMAGYPHDYQQGREVYRAMIAAQEKE
jgi:hypothetical protein